MQYSKGQKERREDKLWNRSWETMSAGTQRGRREEEWIGEEKEQKCG